MNNDDDGIDPALERRVRTALLEMMPQLESPDEVSWWGDAEPAAAPAGAVVRPHDAVRGARSLRVAAAVIAVVGIGASLLVSLDRSSRHASPAASSPPSSGSASTVAATSGSLLSTPVPAGSQPMMVLDRAGWTMDGYQAPGPVDAAGPSTTCAGCGVSRLIVAQPGSVLGGPVFSAWTLEADYDVTNFEWPVTIGTTSGRFIGSQDGSTPAASNRVRVVWPIAPGRTAFVDAVGFSNADVFAMSATLTFAAAVPVLPSVPAGFAVVSTPTDTALTTQTYHVFDGGVRDASGQGTSVVELVVTDGGLQGLLDWRRPLGQQDWGEPRILDGATVLVDHPAGADEPPILAISATWVVGNWSFTAVGHRFQSEADFLDVVAGLRLTDPATFDAATAAASTYVLGAFHPSVDGTSGEQD